MLAARARAVLEPSVAEAVTQQATAFAIVLAGEALFSRNNIPESDKGRPEVVPVAAGVGAALAASVLVGQGGGGFLPAVGLVLGLVGSGAMVYYNVQRFQNLQYNDGDWPGPKAWPGGMGLISFFAVNVFFQALVAETNIRKASTLQRAVFNAGADPADENLQEPWLDLFPNLEELRWQMIKDIEAEADTNYGMMEEEVHSAPKDYDCHNVPPPGRQTHSTISNSHASQSLGVEHDGAYAFDLTDTFLKMLSPEGLSLLSWPGTETMAVLAKKMQAAYFASPLSCLVPCLNSTDSDTEAAVLEGQMLLPGYDGMTLHEARQLLEGWYRL
eukprot:gene11014-11168_t